ncbi:MAG: aminoglycoside phosphotransferase, partial [Microbacteriaceae bacterium]|nr:aminoglycoside phosphotransferase [Microbacteriaceae bacterium]
MTQALPGAMVIAAGSLTQNSAGRYDSAVALLADGTKVAVRAPADADAGRELAAETLALRALTV